MVFPLLPSPLLQTVPLLPSTSPFSFLSPLPSSLLSAHLLSFRSIHLPSSCSFLPSLPLHYLPMPFIFIPCLPFPFLTLPFLLFMLSSNLTNCDFYSYSFPSILFPSYYSVPLSSRSFPHCPFLSSLPTPFPSISFLPFISFPFHLLSSLPVCSHSFFLPLFSLFFLPISFPFPSLKSLGVYVQKQICVFSSE